MSNTSTKAAIRSLKSVEPDFCAHWRNFAQKENPHTTRRQFGARAQCGSWRGRKFDSVKIGNQSYSFRDMPLDAAIQAMAAMGLKECELSQGHMEPPKLDQAGSGV